MNEAIKLANKHGYRNPNNSGYTHSSDILMDSAFWQALGKALGWIDREGNQQVVGVRTMDDSGLMSEWNFHWHRFIDHIADGKSPDDFFKALLAERRAV